VAAQSARAFNDVDSTDAHGSSGTENNSGSRQQNTENGYSNGKTEYQDVLHVVSMPQLRSSDLGLSEVMVLSPYPILRKRQQSFQELLPLPRRVARDWKSLYL